MINKIFMGEGKDSYSAMQGPCSNGFHIPSDTELQGLIDTMTALSLIADDYRTKLKIPFAGLCRLVDGVPVSQGSYASLRSSSPIAWGSGVNYLLINSSIGIYNGDRAVGFNIRSFKDSVVVPDGTWTVLYQGTGDAGIFHNTTDGIISISSDGTNWITIADKNLGATVVYNDGDTLDQTNCGNYYQWGNNYGFLFTGAVTTDSNQVDTTGYGPGNYYSSSTFITGNNDWSNPANDNLRGGVTGVQKVSNVSEIYAGDGESASKGPCPVGFHVPGEDENATLVNTITTLGIDTSNGNCMKTYLKMPFAGYRLNSTAGASGQGTTAGYWSSTAHSADYISYLSFGSTFLYSQRESYRSFGYSIRCFKDIPVIPDSNWTTLYAGTGDAGIFHNTTDGLISISSDGINWITIADKNLGATVVYNDGDTLDQTNCGNYYQRGNNYGFPWDSSASITTDSTQVDASTYGPGNYYTSSTFIIIIGNNDWSSVRNDDLRGGVTGASTRISNVLAVYQGEEIIFGDASKVPIKTAGIYHNPALGLISLSSDGKSRITIADKNLGATVVYNDGDTLSQSNCGNYYQRGNDYGFPWDSSASITGDSTQVDASTYGPSNHYNSSTFIIGHYDWSSVQNDNLWGGEETVYTDLATQGPCPSGYHVPSKDENVNLTTIMTTLGIDTTNGNCLKTYLKMPFAGGRGRADADVYGQGTDGFYCSANAYSTNYAYYLFFYSSALSPQNGYFRSIAFSLRPFKNVPVPPKGDWTPLYVASNSNTIPGNSVVINPNDPGNIELY